MKLSAVSYPKIQNQVNFKGYANKKNTEGTNVLEFFAPPYDKSKYDISLEITTLTRNEDAKNKKEIYSTTSDTTKLYAIKQDSTDGKFRISKSITNMLTSGVGEHLGYHFVLTDKKTGSKKYILEPGLTSLVNDTQSTNYSNVFNVIPKNASAVEKRGPMYHMFIDSYYNPSWKTNTPKAKRNHFNIFGGNIQGIIEQLRDGKLDSYGLLMTTPIFGKDEMSSHGYWTVNPFQIANTKGTLEDFKNLNFELFKRGKQYIADGAFTSQGYQSPLIQNVLSYGKESPFANWFTFDATKENLTNTMQIGMPALPASEDALKHTRYKIIEKNNRIELQIYDERFVNQEDIKNNELIKSYSLDKQEDSNDINSYKDSCNLYHFDITSESRKTIERLKENAGKPLEDKMIKLTNFSITQADNARGASFWDGNFDLIKMNLAQGTLESEQAKHYLFNIATYWTKTINDSLVYKSAVLLNEEELKQIAQLNGLSNGEFETIKNKLQDEKYKFTSIGNFKDNDEKFLLNEILEYPLQAMEMPDKYIAALTSPSISPNLKTIEDKNKTNIELVDNTKVASFYKVSLLEDVKKALNIINEKNNTIYNNGKLTDFGRLIAKQIIPDVVKYSVIKKLSDGESVKIVDGNIEYSGFRSTKFDIDKAERQSTSYNSITSSVANALAGSDDILSNEELEALTKKYVEIKPDKLKLSQAVVEQTGNGLNWRFDAAKDVSSFEKTKRPNNNNGAIRSFESTWDSAIDFWKEFIKKVKEQNQSSYMIGEITDIGSYFDYTRGEGQNGIELNEMSFGKYVNANIAERTFFEKTGMTTGSNYSQFFGPYPELFGSNIEHGYSTETSLNDIYNKSEELTTGNPLSYIVNNHIFTDNHDKPRTMHGFALDMEKFLKNKGSGASDFYNDALDRISADVINSETKQKLKNAINLIKVGKLSTDDKENPDRARAFGTRPFEVSINTILDIAEIKNETERKNIAKAILESGLEIPMEKYKAMWQIMVGGIGTPAIFSGDEYAQTGHETPSKNQELGCRNIILHDRATASDSFGNFYRHINATSGLYKLDGLSAISGGVPVTFKVGSINGSDNVTGVYKYDSKGSEVMNIMFLGNSIIKKNGEKLLDKLTFNPYKTNVNSIILNNEKNVGIKEEIFVEGTKYKKKVYDKANGRYIDSNEIYIIKDRKLVREDDKPIELTTGNNIFYKV